MLKNVADKVNNTCIDYGVLACPQDYDHKRLTKLSYGQTSSRRRLKLVKINTWNHVHKQEYQVSKGNQIHWVDLRSINVEPSPQLLTSHKFRLPFSISYSLFQGFPTCVHIFPQTSRYFPFTTSFPHLLQPFRTSHIYPPIEGTNIPVQKHICLYLHVDEIFKIFSF